MVMGKKLTPAQQRVLDLMTEGYELAQSMAFDGRTWLQEGGAGKGGHVESANANTAQALRLRGLIEINKQAFPLRTYRLTATGTGAK